MIKVLVRVSLYTSRVVDITPDQYAMIRPAFESFLSFHRRVSEAACKVFTSFYHIQLCVASSTLFSLFGNVISHYLLYLIYLFIFKNIFLTTFHIPMLPHLSPATTSVLYLAG